MSDSRSPPPELPQSFDRSAHLQRRDGCGTAFMILVGLILLLPGLCTILLTGGHIDGGTIRIAAITFLVGIVGIAIIALSIRGFLR
jgi:hypothetical protein